MRVLRAGIFLTIRRIPDHVIVQTLIVDVEREVDSNRLSDDIRHWYIDFVKANYDAADIENADKEHVRLAGKPNAHWENNANPTRKTIK